MTAPRRMGAESSKTRHLLLDTVERLMAEEGYAAVGVRRVAREAGVAPALVLYYFRTLDDLFLATMRRRFDQEIEAQAKALESDELIKALWEYNGQPEGAVLNLEFIALANHRKAIRGEVAAHAERLRNLQQEAVARYLAKRGIGPDALPPLALTVLISMASRSLVLEDTMGLTLGHAELQALIERYLRQPIDGRSVVDER
ncbi:TetR/AcrR family transcriptional regulator [Actinocorallia aurea]